MFLLPSAAQVDNASLSGTVQDPSGGVVAGAVVTARNTNTGVQHSMPTNTSGAYVFPNLIPGPYLLTVKAQGFAEETIQGIFLEIGQQARTDIKLRLANVGQEVTVISAPPLLQTEDASVGTVIDGEHVSALPLDGQQFTQVRQLSLGHAGGCVQLPLQIRRSEQRAPTRVFRTQRILPALTSLMIYNILRHIDRHWRCKK